MLNLDGCRSPSHVAASPNEMFYLRWKINDPLSNGYRREEDETKPTKSETGVADKTKPREARSGRVGKKKG